MLMYNRKQSKEMSEKPEGTIKNGQSRNTGNIDAYKTQDENKQNQTKQHKQYNKHLLSLVNSKLRKDIKMKSIS
jgi:hypothetical protein